MEIATIESYAGLIGTDTRYEFGASAARLQTQQTGYIVVSKRTLSDLFAYKRV
jgi:hypothetical protein